MVLCLGWEEVGDDTSPSGILYVLFTCLLSLSPYWNVYLLFVSFPLLECKVHENSDYFFSFLY